MTDVGRVLMLLGLAIALIGGVVYALGRVGFRGLPGDVNYQSPHLRVYFPVVSCLVLSALLTLAMWLWRWWTGGR